MRKRSGWGRLVFVIAAVAGLALAGCLSAPDPETGDRSHELSTSSEDRIADLGDRVDELVADGTLHFGSGNALWASLRAALQSLDAGEDDQAIDELGAFINKVEALVRSRRLDAAIGAELIAAAEAAIDAILNPPLAAPMIDPTSGPPTTPFTITDPKGRMVFADRVIFAPLGSGPSDGTFLFDAETVPPDWPWSLTVEFSADGTTATGHVPASLERFVDYEVTVHNGDPSTNPQLFESLLFEVH